MDIKSTTLYKQFKTIKGNRPVIEAHVKKIAQVMLDRDWSDNIPIYVNDKMEIIDGQHRFEARVKANLPIYYIILKNATLMDVIMLNSNTKSWNLTNYIQSYIERGKDDYKKLYEFMIAYDFPPITAVAILSGVDKNCGKAIRDGYFRILNYDRADKIAQFITTCRNKVGKSVKDDRAFMNACIKVYNNNDVNKDKFFIKLTNQGQNIKRQTIVIDYLREFEAIYNFKAQKIVRFF